MVRKASCPRCATGGEFQKVLLQIRSGADAAAWRGEIDKYAKASGDDA